MIDETHDPSLTSWVESANAPRADFPIQNLPFVLDFDSELTFSGDSGDTEPNRPSRRIGVEWANRYRAAPWAILDGDFAYTYVRFKDTDNPIAPNQPRSSPSVMPAEATMAGAWGMKLPIGLSVSLNRT